MELAHALYKDRPRDLNSKASDTSWNLTLLKAEVRSTPSCSTRPFGQVAVVTVVTRPSSRSLCVVGSPWHRGRDRSLGTAARGLRGARGAL